MTCCKNSDEVFARAAEDRAAALALLGAPEQLREILWQVKGPLAMDNTCRCAMGSGRAKSPFACVACRNMELLLDLRMGGVERAFVVECGKQAAKTMAFSTARVTAPRLELDSRAYNRAVAYVASFPDVLSCGTPAPDSLRCVTGDPFTIKTLLQWKIQTFSRHVPTCHSAFICNNVGHSLYRCPSVGPLSQLLLKPDAHEGKDLAAPLTTRCARGVLLQLLAALDQLAEHNFSHGNANERACVFDSEPCAYKYKGCRIEGPYALMLSDLWNCSATFDGVHYFPEDRRAALAAGQYYYTPMIRTVKDTSAYCEENELAGDQACAVEQGSACADEYTRDTCRLAYHKYFVISDPAAELYRVMRHSGVPMFVGAFDFYCFIVSFMCTAAFRAAVLKDKALYRLWGSMWVYEDLGEIEARVGAHQEGVADPVALLRGLRLRCDVVPALLGHVAAGW